MAALTIGIDFGTTNSAVARVGSGGNGEPTTEMAYFTHATGETDVYRSILYFEHYKTPAPPRTVGWTGPTAIERYLAAETKGAADSVAQVVSDEPQPDGHRRLRTPTYARGADRTNPARRSRAG